MHVAESAVPRGSRQLSHPGDRFVSQQPLGALYTHTGTTFRVFAPTADSVRLHLYERAVGGSAHLVELQRNSDGTWETFVQGDCRDLYYTYTASGSDRGFRPNHEVIDPYARCVTAFNGRGLVVADSTPVAPRPKFAVQDAIIYEMHLRDFTIDPDCGVVRRGKYLGLTEPGTRLFGRPDVTTGLDHLTELGINTVQILPIMQFQNDETTDVYGWGYDSIHFNSPHGWYATERMDVSRVRETKLMIDALHKRGIRVVLDVVYNHTMEDIHNRVYSFEGLVPGYYYRRRSDGSYFNGSGVGNEFRSESPMGRRFIVDSVKYWVEEYQVDGFRFDLMGLIDLGTMQQMVRELHAIDPNILVYGEPWASGDTPIAITHKGTQRGQGFSVFNDHFRDALKGSVFNARERGFVQSGGNADGVKVGIVGSIDDFAQEPTETINYVECHDNHTFWDRIYISTADDASVSDADRRAMDKLGAAVLFTSQGIPFMQAGQEMLRTKWGDHNSYNKPDAINMIRWRTKLDNLDVFSYYKGLIALRRAHPMFRLAKAEQVRHAVHFWDGLPGGVVGYVLHDVTEHDTWARAAVLFNGSHEAVKVAPPRGHWLVYVNSQQAGAMPIEELPRPAMVPPRSALVLGEPRH